MSRGNPCGVWARHSRSRGTVRATRRPVSSVTSFTVSLTGSAAIAATPVRARAMTASIVARTTNGRAASCTSTTADARSALSPAATEWARVSPPATRVSRSPASRPSQSGGRSAYPGGSVTTTWSTSGCEVKGRSARSSIGTPRIERNCFGSPGPARTPAPAATITTPTSGGEAAGEVTDALHAHDFEPVRRAARARRAEHAAEPLPRRLGETALQGRDRPDLAAQPDLAEEHGVGWHGPVAHAGHQRREHGEVGGGLGEADATGHVDEHVERAEREVAASLQDREQHGEPAVVEPGGHALRGAEAGLRRQRLHLDEHGTRALHERRDRRAGDARVASGEKGGRGIGDGLEARLRHAEHADLVHRAEAVFHRAQDAMVEGRFALEVKDGVHDVLEGARSRDPAALGDVADEEHGGPRFLGEAHQPGGAVADLPDVAGRALELLGIGGLDRVHEDDAGAERGGVMDDRLEARFAEHVDGAGVFAEPNGT